MNIGVRSRGLILLVVVLALGVPVATHAAGGRVFDRSALDRPDDVSGPQYHLVYVIPSDGVDHGYAADGSIARSWLHFEGWLAGQAGGRVYRTDTYQGSPDVTFIRLNEPGSQLATMGSSLMRLIDSEVEPGGQDSTKKFLFFYDAPTLDLLACGYGQQPGHYGIIYLQNGSACEGIGTSGVDYVAGHEATHVAGAVGSCAPHFGGGGHVIDTGNGHDLMNGGGTGNGSVAQVLDPGHDDYYGENVPAGCFNLADSPLLTTQPLSLLNTATVSITGGENVGTVTVGSFGACVSKVNGTRCAIYFPHGAPVTLTATPAPGWSFSNWSNDLVNCSNPCVVSSGNDVPIVTAVFIRKVQVTLGIYVSGQGTVTVNGTTCSPCTFDAGSQITLAAAPAAGWHFASWSGMDDCASSTCTTTLTSSKSVNVRFLPDNYMLTVSVVGRGTVTIGAIGRCTSTCTFAIPADETTGVTEHPMSGRIFKAWGGSAANGCAKLTCHITPTRDVRLVATFVSKPKTKTQR